MLDCSSFTLNNVGNYAGHVKSYRLPLAVSKNVVIKFLSYSNIVNPPLQVGVGELQGGRPKEASIRQIAGNEPALSQCACLAPL